MKNNHTCLSVNKISFIKFLVFLLCISLVLISFSPFVLSAPSSKLQYTFKFRQPDLKQKELFNEIFTEIDMPGTLSIGTDPGKPVVQVESFKILLPFGTELDKLTVEIDEIVKIDLVSKGIDLKENPIKPYQRPIPIGEEPPESLIMDYEAYDSGNFFPEITYENLGVDYCRGYAILTINLFPTRYSPKDGGLYYYPEMTVNIDLKEANFVNRFYRDSPDDEVWVKSLVINPIVAETYDGPIFGDTRYEDGLCDSSDNGGLGYDYVIITRQSLADFTATYNWTDLKNKKISEGLQTTLVTVEDIENCADYWNSTDLFNDTEANIREFCKDAYEDWGTQYVLIAGDHEGAAAIPRRLMDYSYESNVESDLYWSNLDGTFNDDSDGSWGESGDTGFDLYSELFIGNVPCDEPDDISNWLTKNFYYADSLEQDYLENAAFYGGDTGWSCQGDDFLDFTLYGTENWLGPDPEHDGPWPSFLGFLYGFDTWNNSNPDIEFNTSVRWTAEDPNPGWSGGSEPAAISGLRDAINNDNVTLLSGIAHANSGMSLDVYSSSWESEYHNTKPFFNHDYGCHCGDMSAADDGVLHSMLFHSDTELAFACVMNTGYGWGNLDCTNSSSALQQKLFWDYMFNLSKCGGTMNWQLGKAQAYSRDAMAPTINWDPGYETWRGIIQSCLLFGDPALAIKPPVMPEHNIGIQSIDISSHVTPGETVFVNATLVNNGQNNETDVYVSFRINDSKDTEIDNTTISFFESLTTEDVSFTWTPSIGVYTVIINVSVPGVTEDFYMDNEKSKIVIAGPDIEVSNINVPLLVGLGFSTNVSGTIVNLGTSNEDVTVNFWVNSILEDSRSIALNSSESVLITYPWTPSKLGTYPVGISANLSISEPYLENNEMYNDVTVMKAIFVDSVESGEGSWTHNADSGSDMWHISERDSYSSSHSWYCGSETGGTYGHSMDNSLITPVLNLTGYNEVTLTFWHKYDFESASTVWDGSDVEISVEGGSWEQIIPEGGYDDVIYGSSNGAFPSGTPVYAHSSNGWKEAEFNLTDYIDHDVQLRFRFGSDGSVAYEGWYIDDIILYGDSIDLTILNVQASPQFQETNGWVNISCDVTADAGVNLVKANITYPGSSTVNQTMINIPGTDTYYYNSIYSNSGSYDFFIWADDTGGNQSVSEDYTFKIGIPPEISLIEVVPYIQDTGGYVNITCIVTDNDLVNSVLINITDPNSIENSSIMVRVGMTDAYYYNSTYILNGTYSFIIFAEDNHGNGNISEESNFHIGVTVVNIPIEIGWDLITIPVDNDMSMASSLAENITGCLSVHRWDAVNQTYKPYFVGGPEEFDFAITSGMGLFIEVDEASTLVLSGAPAFGVSIDLKVIWDMIGWYHQTGTMASSLAENITGCLSVHRWDAVNQTYKPYFVGGPEEFDFAITPGMGLFVEVDEESTWNGEG